MDISEIEVIAPGLEKLSTDERDAIFTFTLLWTLFEAKILDTHGSVENINRNVRRLGQDIVTDGWFGETLDYFCNRYVTDGKANRHFDGLRLRIVDRPLVLEVLSRINTDNYAQLQACLLIVHRFRNNFFHGNKWEYNIGGQLDNFSHSSRLLKECLIRFPQSD